MTTADPTGFVPAAMAAKLRGIARELRQQAVLNLEDEALARRLDTYADTILRPEIEGERWTFFWRFQHVGTRSPDKRTALG